MFIPSWVVVLCCVAFISQLRNFIIGCFGTRRDEQITWTRDEKKHIQLAFSKPIQFIFGHKKRRRRSRKKTVHKPLLWTHDGIWSAGAHERAYSHISNTHFHGHFNSVGGINQHFKSHCIWWWLTCVIFLFFFFLLFPLHFLPLFNWSTTFFLLLFDFASLDINILLLGDIFLLLFYRRKEKKKL